MSPDLLGRMLIILALSVAVIYVGLRLRMPAIVGFLVTGVIVGPQGLGLIADPHQVDSLAELGVVLLLFTIGLEFSIGSLIKIKRIVLLGGGLQVLLGALGSGGVMFLLDFKWNTSILFGFLFALSSTAIVLKLFQERGEMDAPHGQAALAVLIFQDLAVVPLVLLLPVLAGQEGGQPIYVVLLKAAALIAIILVMANTLVPRLLSRVAGTKSRELFMFTVVLLCLGTAFLTAEAGLSLSLGAFVAGLIISGSPYAQQAISTVLPMRDIFTSIFFVSIGMLMDLRFLAEHPMLTVGTALGVMVLNVITTSLSLRLVGLNWRVAVMVGFALCQVGEFAFVLARDGLELGLLSQADMALFLNAAVLTMALTPLALAAGRAVAPKFQEVSEASKKQAASQIVKKSGHAVIVGFGVVGQAVARACGVAGINYEIIEMNPHTVKRYQGLGTPISYGDAVNEAVLEHAGLPLAKVMVVTIPDPVATRRIVSAARDMNPEIYLIARTRFLMEMETLRKMGADEIIPEEYETAVAVFARVMFRFLVPVEEIETQVAQARAEGYDMFRSMGDAPLIKNEGDYESLVKGLDFLTLTVQEGSRAAGKSLAELNLRNAYGLNVIVIRRGPTILTNPAPGDVLAPTDQVVALSSKPLLVPAAYSLFHRDVLKAF